ncbi:MAG TPA: tRNA1(Val) (adenine(37)-N6)-methyltransferase [Clostridiales bacterium]|jgi:tRNA1Val (adenine37-N6)-methyltransferase|nr:tRNA1(Val) (adenine(37)-N6)-methyltransferase [Clostridiales bacterium]
MEQDQLWSGGPVLLQSENVFKLGTDSVLLSDFALDIRAQRAVDLGCGCGVIAIALACQKDIKVDAIDISEAAAELTRRNVSLNGLEEKVKVICGDVRRHREFFEAGAYDLVVTNPPYFAGGSGKTAKEEAKALARDERECTLSDIVEAAAYLIRWGGSFAIVYRPERLSELFCAMTAAGIEPKRLRMVQYKVYSAPNMVLVEGRRGGRPGLKIEPPLIMTHLDGTDTEEIKRIYRRT